MPTKLHDFIDCLERGALFLRAQTPSSSGNVYSLLADEEILSHAKKAIAFDIGELFLLADMSIKAEMDLMRLPYPVCWFEATGGFAKHTAFLLFESSDPDDYGRLFGGRCLHVMIFASHHPTDYWIYISQFSAVLDASDRSSVPIFSLSDKFHENFESVATAFLPLIKNYLMALNCNNIERIEHRPDEKLQRRRAKRGKKPLHSYWTLHIRQSSAQSCGDGTQASPRIHLRRGHARQYKPGKFTWVQPCVVRGQSPGIVEKDYAL